MSYYGHNWVRIKENLLNQQAEVDCDCCGANHVLGAVWIAEAWMELHEKQHLLEDTSDMGPVIS